MVIRAGSQIIYPEMLEYAWVKELDRVTANSRNVPTNKPTLLSDLPKVPIDLVLTVMKEAMSYPEVMAAYGSAPLDGQIPPRESHLLMWFEEYVSHKYGPSPGLLMVLTIPMRKMANGHYLGVDDGTLVAELKNDPFICEKNGERNEQ